MRTLLVLASLLLVAFAGCTSSAGDSDGDTVPDETERAGWVVVVTYMDRRVAYTVTSDPDVFDTDGDGLSDYDEIIRGLDPRKADTDEDGLSDCQETVHSNRTECEDKTYFDDDDGGIGTDPLNADSDSGRSQYALRQPFIDETGTLPGGRAITGDGISDGDEWHGRTIDLGGGRTRFVTTDPRSADTDGDLLDDGTELEAAFSDPTVVDSDGDGCIDGRDAYPAHVESYDAGLEEITVIAGGKADGQQIRIRVLVVDQDQYLPGATSWQTFGAGSHAVETTPGEVSALGCNYNFWNPWTYIEVLAFGWDGNQGYDVDMWTNTLTEKDGKARIWWNVREQIFSWTRDGTPIPSPLSVGGADLEARLVPQVLGV